MSVPVILLLLACSCHNPLKANSDGEVSVLGVDIAKWKIDHEHNTATVLPGANRAFDTVRAQFLDSSGNKIGNDVVADYDSTTGFSLEIPEGAVVIRGTLIDANPNNGPSFFIRRKLPLPFAPATTFQAPIVFSTDWPATLFTFEVPNIHSFEELDPILDPIMAYGPGIPLPPTVHLRSWYSFNLEADGLHMLFGTPGTFERLDLRINDHTASLQNLATYSFETWEMAAGLAPLDVLDIDEDPDNEARFVFGVIDEPLVIADFYVGD